MRLIEYPWNTTQGSEESTRFTHEKALFDNGRTMTAQDTVPRQIIEAIS